MRWNVEGADPKTGQEHVYSVEADTAEEAEQQVRRKGVLVSAVHPSSVQSEQDQLDELAAAARGRTVRTGAAPAPKAGTAPSIPYRSPATTAAASVPDYTGLRFGSGVLMIFALLYYVVGGLGLVGAVLMLASGATQQQFAVGAVGSFAMTLSALTLAMIGGLLHALSAACLALLDIARNSFNR